MNVKISGAAISGHLQAPPSKSSMQRACAAALLHRGTTYIHNPGISNDDLAAIHIIEQLGATVQRKNDSLLVTSSGFPAIVDPKNISVHCGESGLSARLFASIVALSSTEIILNGEGSLLKRPMDFFENLFPRLNVSIVSENSCLPLCIRGPLQPAAITIDGSLSSQFLTGLLFAYSNAVKEPVTISVTDLKSKAYIDLTLDVMNRFGYRVDREAYSSFTLHPVNRERVDQEIHYTVEGDWSGAAFLLVAGAIAGEVTVSGLDMHSSQPDKAIMDVLSECSAGIVHGDNNITIIKKPLQAFQFDATDCPDLFPPLVALAAYCKGTSVIKGTSRLRAKESDRAITLQQVFGETGIHVVLENDDMLIQGGAVTGGTVSSHNDHRIAMAVAVAALGAVGTTIIEHADAVNKSYPGFFAGLSKLGALPEIIET